MLAPREVAPQGNVLGDDERKALSISALLILLVTSVIIPALLYCALLIYSFGASEQDRYELRAKMAAREAAAAVDRELRAKLGALQTVGRIFLVDSRPDFYVDAKEIANYQHSDIRVFDAH